MTIDEAITYEKGKAFDVRVDADNCISRSKEHDQIAEWLEKYKQVEFEVNWYLDACSKDKGNKQYNMDIAFNSILKTVLRKGSADNE